MPVSSRRLSTTPYFPGAWPAAPQDEHDDTQDADVSSVSSCGSVVANARARKDSSRKAHRRWTYTGPLRLQVRTTDPSSPLCMRAPLASTSMSADQDYKMSPCTDTTVSTALSSPLNTPDLADWPTRIGGGSQSLLLDNIACPDISPSSVTRFDQALPSLRHTRLLSSASRDTRFASPHLDPPLLNFIPGLPSLRPLPELSTGFPYQESPISPSPSSEVCSPSSSDIPSPRRGIELPSSFTEPSSLFAPSNLATDFYPVAEVIDPSPHLTSTSVTDSQASDSPVLPPTTRLSTSGGDYMRAVPPIPEMDAFALAAAVASFQSRSSFSISPSVHSSAALPTTSLNVASSEAHRLNASRLPTATTEATLGHRRQEAPYSRDDIKAASQLNQAAGYKERRPARVRRLSAPSPTFWHSSRPQIARTISSRVDVGEANAIVRRDKDVRQPVLGKMRKLGERIRGLFKSKGEPPSRITSPNPSGAAEYGLMTTTTSITNVEYESEHPIPLPSPRARTMRNHRRSLPIQSLLPSSLDRQHSTIVRRAAPNSDCVAHPSSSSACPPPPGFTEDLLPESTSQDPRRSPHTPKPRRERTQTAPQAAEDGRKPANERKARRFSLSSVLTKSKIDSLRSTVVPRPPLPKSTSRAKDDLTAGSVTQSSALDLVSSTAAGTNSATSTALRQHDDEFWGSELSNVRDAQVIPSADIDSSTLHFPVPQLQTCPNTPRNKSSRRFSLSSMMHQRSTRPLDHAHRQATEHPSALKPSKLSRRRPRGDTVTTLTHEAVRFDVAPKLVISAPSVDNPTASNRTSLAPSLLSSGGESAYFDAQEYLSEADHHSTCSLRPESDLDSMSFARTPEYSSATFSFGSSTEREYHYHERSETSMASSYVRGHDAAEIVGEPSTVTHGFGDNAETPITKTLRFSPSLSLSFDMSCSDLGDEDATHSLERAEDIDFMRALGFEFDQIVRRARGESL